MLVYFRNVSYIDVLVRNRCKYSHRESYQSFQTASSSHCQMHLNAAMLKDITFVRNRNNFAPYFHRCNDNCTCSCEEVHIGL